MDIDYSKIKKILVITLNNIGDVILTTSVISLLRERFPSAYLATVVGPKAEMVLIQSKIIDQIFIYDKRASWWTKFKFVARLRRERFDLVVDLKNTAVPFLVNPRYRTPIGLDRSLPLMREQHLSRLQFLMPVTFEEENRFDFFSEEEELSTVGKFRQCTAQSFSSDFIALALGTRMPLKQWNISGFAQVALYFLEKGRTVVIVGGKDEVALGQEFERLIQKPVVNLIGKLSLRELAALFSHASLVIANDSAPLHLALELNRPVVGLFGPTDEIKCGRRGAKFYRIRLPLDCAPCEQARCRLERRICLDDLPATSVIQACEELLSGATN